MINRQSPTALEHRLAYALEVTESYLKDGDAQGHNLLHLVRETLARYYEKAHPEEIKPYEWYQQE